VVLKNSGPEKGYHESDADRNPGLADQLVMKNRCEAVLRSDFCISE